jgi:mono/diheme cytochrome c family protein
MKLSSHELNVVSRGSCGIGSARLVVIFTALFMVLSMAGCVSQRQKETYPKRADIIRFDEKDLLDVGSSETADVVLDPVYQTHKQYRGATFGEFLKRRGITLGQLPKDSLVQFLCDDGYDPISPLSSLLAGEAFLATSDLSAPPGASWIPFHHGNSQREPGPVFLVWPHSGPTKDGTPWPYGIVAIRITSGDALLAPALPRSATYQQGFDLFRKNCMVCHSINGVGGTLGVELNQPRNVFEYWQADKLGAYVAHPDLFRRNGKMPSFAQLGTPAISEILAYIKHMKAHKASATP